MRAGGPVARRHGGERGHAGQPDQNEHRPERQRAGNRAGNDQQREHERTGNADHHEGAACPPNPFVAVERTREQRQPRHVAESRWGERVDQRAHAVAGAGVEPADAPADEPNRRAPGACCTDERAEKADAREPEPGRPGVREPGERTPNLRTEQLGHEGDRKQRERERSGGREDAVRVLDDEVRRPAGAACCRVVLYPSAFLLFVLRRSS